MNGICALCGKEEATHIAKERDPPHREVKIGDRCFKRSHSFYKSPYWKITSINKDSITSIVKWQKDPYAGSHGYSGRWKPDIPEADLKSFINKAVIIKELGTHHTRFGTGRSFRPSTRQYMVIEVQGQLLFIWMNYC